ncbi:delta-1-pyrroline-5-carboxylate dehydrogenase 12A1, mitochondrial-like protein [Tanacetum coccineum]
MSKMFRICNQIRRNKNNVPRSLSFSRFINSLQFATVKTEEISGCKPAEVANLVQGNWIKSGNWNTILDPLNGESFIRVSEIDESGIKPFVESLSKCPKHGLHNPFKSPESTQLKALLYMANQPVLKIDSKSRISNGTKSSLLHACGMPAEDVDFINSDGPTMNKLLLEANPRMTLFTGSSRIADKLAYDLNGRIKLEDAGFDWKILGPDVQEVDYVSWVCDQDAYACSGQKCSAQSLLFMHENWGKTSLMSQLSELAGRRKLDNLTIGPVLTVTTKAMLDHKDQLLKIPGSKLLWGGEELPNHSIPSIYGAIKPTAVFVPLEQILKPEHYDLVTKEIFGPFQIVTEYKDCQVPMVLEALERMHAHLTAAVVSNDPLFVQGILGNTVNGTTYAGLRARTTGAPQNHWFGPAGDPRGAGIGTPEAIKLVWSCHREVIYDFGPVPHKWQIPPST